jgi:hypothetical protein
MMSERDDHKAFGYNLGEEPLNNQSSFSNNLNYTNSTND